MMDTVVEANETACWLWWKLGELDPMMGPHEMLQWDNAPWVLLEYINSKALTKLQDDGVLDWIYLVSPGMAIVQPRPPIQGITDLDAFVEKIKEYNTNLGKKKAREGGYYVERVVINKGMMNDPAIKAVIGENPGWRAVYYERMEARDPKQFVHRSKAAEARTPSEVVVTLNNFHYTKDVNLMKKLLEDTVTPYLVGILKVHGIINPDHDNDCLTWVPCGTMVNWRLLTPSEEASNYLCKHVVEKAVMFQDMAGHIQFRSKYHALAKTDVQHYLQTKMLLDVTSQHEAPSHRMPTSEPGAREPAADTWARPATPRSSQPSAASTHVPTGVPTSTNLGAQPGAPAEQVPNVGPTCGGASSSAAPMDAPHSAPSVLGGTSTIGSFDLLGSPRSYDGQP